MSLDYLIFGGSGFVGTHLSNYLEDIGSSFLIADLIEPIKQDLSFKVSDVRENLSLDIENNPATIIVNLAAVHKTPGHPNKDYFETNIKGAENVCDFARDKNINTIVFTSSIAVYGTYEGKKSEKTLPMPDIPYGISKLSAEYIHKKWQSEDPLNRRLIILRPGVVFGMYEKANFTRLINSLKRNYFSYVGRKDTKKACVYVKDLVQVIYELSIDKTIKIDTFNVSYNPPLSIEEIVSSISETGEMKFPRFVVPRWFVIFLSSIMYYIFKKKDFNPERMKKLVISNNIDSEKINNKIKFNFGFSKGISDWMYETEFLKQNKIY
jgi:nucleoside-diphosphate-sugar epimerase